MAGVAPAKQDRTRSSGQLYICLLGAPEVTWQDAPLAIARRQARALLYRLAATAHPAARDALCFLFWPDVGESTARRNLSRLLTILHNALPDPTLLLARDDQIVLHPERAGSDTQVFEQLWTRWLADGDVNHLRQAAALYCGPFLDGFCLPDSPEFDTWASLERERWMRLALQTLAALVEALTLDGDYPAAIGYACRSLSIDELAEDIHRRLVELYALAGQRSAALRQYEQCMAVLERELGVAPMPETVAVYRAVLRGAALSAVPAVAPPKVLWPAAVTPLIGRDAALHALDEAYRQAQAGHGRAVLISGEPGVGKSRLLQEFAGRVRGQALVLTGSCYPETRTSPYQPLIETLRPHLHMRRFEFEAYPDWLADLAQLFPELRPSHPGLAQPPAGEPGWARTRLFEALETLLLRLAQGVQPLVLCLDDLHWADSATLDWLAYLSRQSRSRPLLLVTAYRSAEGDPLQALRASLAQQGMLREQTLEGLDPDAVDELLCHLGGPLAADRTLAGRLHQATAGNPFFLLEVLAALVETGECSEPAGGAAALPLPDSVCQAVHLRVEQLNPTTRQVLEAAAVAGQAFAPDTLHLLAGRAELETADALDELAGRQFLLQEPGQVRFRHEIVREVVYRGLSAYRRGLLHRRAGEVLERAQPAASAALARHFAGAGQPGKAARYALQAGLAARSVFAHVEARSHFDQAVALLEQEAAGLREPAAIAANRRLRIEALSQRGWALRLLGEMDAYAQDLEQEAQLATLLGDTTTLAHLRWRQASLHLWFCRYAQARTAAEDGLRLSQAAGDRRMEAACWRALGLAARASGDYDWAQHALAQALQGFEALDEPSLQVHTLGNLSTLACYQGDPAQALALAQRALAVCEAAGLQPDRRLPLGDMGAAAAALGDGDLARRSLEESLAIARQISDRTQEIFCLGHLGWLDVQEGQVASALEHLSPALALAEQVNSCTEQPWLHMGLAEALRLAGDLDGAGMHAQTALTLAAATGQAHDQRLAQLVSDHATSQARTA